MEWYWLADSAPLFLQGIWVTIKLLVLSVLSGMMLAIPIGLVQVTGPRWLSHVAHAFCLTIRGTPLLIQLWLIYYGLGSLFPLIPGIRESILWPVLSDAFSLAVFAFTLSVAGYEGEVMRSAFRSVPRGELEAARAFGMTRLTVLRRVWLPRALQNVFPTLAGELVLTLKATPLAGTITIIDVYGAFEQVRSETFLAFEPLMLIAAIYLVFTAAITLFFRWAENRIPRPR
jgi:polar amino acid transport system permease protein